MHAAGVLRRVVVLGGGVAGSALALQLGQAGVDVTIVDHPPPARLLVGESLLPAVVPILQRLKIEDRIQKVATFKPGVVFVMRSGRKLNFNLSRLAGVTSTYAYNVPRPSFEAEIRASAIASGVRVVHHKGHVEHDGDRVRLDRNTLDACGATEQPDFVVDATGRAQLIRHQLGINGRPGRRRDMCLFAHFSDVELDAFLPGCAVITAMARGWSWRIPLPGRTSVGVVVNSEELRGRGATNDERLQRTLADDPIMARAMERATKVSETVAYTNYQWITDRIVGTNWAMVGDSAGFIDPTLSSGVLVALQGAEGLAGALLSNPQDGRTFAKWAKTYRRQIATWQELVDYFYDGRLFAMIMQGEDYSSVKWLGPFNRHMERNFTSVVMGARTMSRYSRPLIRFAIQKTIRRYRADDWAIS